MAHASANDEACELFRLGRPATGELEAVRVRAEGHDLTYAVVGASLRSAPVPGFDVHTVDSVVGHGADDFVAATAGLRAWRAHAGVRATVHPPGAAIEQGQVVVVSLPAGPIAVLAPCRVVAVVDEADRFGFAYGSLPGHPVSGEESFLVEHLAGGEVRFTMRVVARPASLAMRLGGPVARWVEHQAQRAYLRGLASAVVAARG